MARIMRSCSKCHGSYDEDFFARTRPVSAIANTRSDRRPVCFGCEQTDRDTAKQANRHRVKARNALRTHADRYRQKALVESTEEFSERFGWSIDQMAHDIEHNAKNGCPYCRRSYASMAHGLADVTLDIIDPRAEPYYRTNVRWVCSTCNKAKQSSTPENWGRKLQNWERWARRQAAIHNDPWSGTLFEGTGSEAS